MRRVVALFAALAAIGAARNLSHLHARPPYLLCAGLFGLVGLCHARAVSFRIGGQSWHIWFVEASVVVILYAVPCVWLLSIVGLGALAAEIFRAKPAQKKLFNVSVALVASGLTIGVYWTFPAINGWSRLGVIALAATVYSFTTFAAVCLVLASLRSESWAGLMMRGMPVSLLSLAGTRASAAEWCCWRTTVP